MKQLSIFKQENKSSWNLFIDGASRNNPGPSGAGIYLLKDGISVRQEAVFLGIKTNNQAEYLALLFGLLFAAEYVSKDERLIINSDSELLVKQILGVYTVKDPKLKKLHEFAKELLLQFDYSVIHVLREFNPVADQLANKAIDKRIPVPTKFLSIWQKYEKSI